MEQQTERTWFSLSKARLFFPGQISLWTIRNWADNGIVSKSTGKRVYLKTRQRGGRRETCMEYYNKFISELNDGEEE